ncbi:MAG: beta-lactamase family protein [Sphingomonas sp.]|uniref:serine hydrolase domain-containing protein n=1 Tax=Sphingomonas sp. TaxID=28214 RepID=UPI0025CFDA9B|nr:serine hydrolase domain-containing protein [Sphingomonas sp.]MBQ1500771.1 beta-lactamase family protein [Sphingomonas sp.]
MAAEAVTGTDYWDLLERRFFRPAGMRSTGPRNRLKPGARMASGHFWNDDRFDDNPPASAPGSTWAAGGLLSTAADMARWSIALDHGRILGSAARRAMWQPALLADGRPAGWGYGWQVETAGGRTIVSHGGGTAGFSCRYRRDLSEPLSTILLTNQNGRADPKTMTDALLAAIRAEGLIAPA